MNALPISTDSTFTRSPRATRMKRLGWLLIYAGFLLAIAPFSRAQLATTPSTTEGPYYPFNSGQTLSTTWLVGADNDLTLVTGKTTRASGTRFLLSGTLVNTAGAAISGATIELWQADNGGIYYYVASTNNYASRDTNFQSYGTCVTDANGNWSFRTVRPGLYTGRIRHFHFKVNVNGTTLLTSQFMFEEDRSSFTSDNVAASLVSAGSIERTVLTPTSGIDSVDNATALLASKQIVVSYTGTGTTTTTTVTTLASATNVTTGHAVTMAAPGSYTGSLQWQVSSDNGSTWSALSDNNTYSGSTTGTLTITGATSSINGYQYRYVVTNGTALTVSNATTLSVASALIPYPASITIDSSSNLYVGDTSTQVIHKISSDNAVTSLAGTSGTAGSADGTGTAATFNQPNGVSSTSAGVVYVSDTANALIRQITAAGVVTTFAGSATTRGNTDATGTSATFAYPVGLTQTSSNVLFVADATNHTIRRITSAGVVTTFAGGAGISGTTDATGTDARFNYPTGVAVDSSGNVYVSDTTNNTIRKITSTGVVTTLAGLAGVSGSDNGSGSDALFNTPGGLAVDSSGNIFVADTGNSTIRKITSAGVVTTFAGLAGVAGLKDGTGTDAWFNQPKSLVFDSSSNLCVADTGNATIRKITSAGVVTTLALSAGTTTTTPTTTTGGTTTGTTSTSTTTASSGGGGGGAPSHFFLSALALLIGLRKMKRARAR